MLSIGSIVWGVTDIPRVVDFWTSALDYELREDPSEDWASLVPRTGEGPRLSLMLVTSDQPRRHHLDLTALDQTAEVERLIELGAFPVEEWEYEEDADYVVLEDPDGNRFCVVQD